MDVILERPPELRRQLGRNLITDGVRAKELAELTLDSTADAVLSADNVGNVMYLNSAAEAMTGWSRSEAKGRPLGEVLQIVDGSTREPLVRDLLRLVIERDRRVPLGANSVLVRRDGHEFPIEDSVAPIHGFDGHVIGAVIVLRDVSEVRATALRMSHLALHDFLTGLPNPALLSDRITQAIALAHRHDKQFAVLFIDLDAFKPVNDLLGHAVGDELLRSVALRLKASIRDSDTVSRNGGDEFVVLLSAIEHAEHAAISAAKIIAAVAASHEIFGRKLRVTASAGIAVYPIDGASTEDLLKSADAAMYQVKDTGGNGYRFSTQAVPAVRSAAAGPSRLARVG